MASWLNMWGGKRDTRKSAQEAIINLRQSLQLLTRKEEHLQKQIDELQAKARKDAVSNPESAKAALRRKKDLQLNLGKLDGQRSTLEAQINTLENANMNREMMEAMKNGAKVLGDINGRMSIDQVDSTMDQIREQMSVANEISNAISTPITADAVDEDELAKELAALEQEELDSMLEGAGKAPVGLPSVASPISHATPVRHVAEEDDEEAQLRALQAELAM